MNTSGADATTTDPLTDSPELADVSKYGYPCRSASRVKSVVDGWLIDSSLWVSSACLGSFVGEFPLFAGFTLAPLHSDARKRGGDDVVSPDREKVKNPNAINEVRKHTQRTYTGYI